MVRQWVIQTFSRSGRRGFGCQNEFLGYAAVHMPGNGRRRRRRRSRRRRRRRRRRAGPAGTHGASGLGPPPPFGHVTGRLRAAAASAAAGDLCRGSRVRRARRRRGHVVPLLAAVRLKRSRVAAP
ncbi:unnamed protein product [Prorocentrum cordatum]|uniref:Uncharacterized protein n=1 Tax=Prorocentrum cordatum TaxID=2364126 RepID=A0ABN9QEK5_9DINO|nr:unnamed protein product [Polarella glacialis]